MAGYNRQRNYGTNRNFGTSFPGDNFGGVSQDRNVPVRRPFERNVPVFLGHGETSGAGPFSPRPQGSFSRYDEQARVLPMTVDRSRNMCNTGNSMQNTLARPDFGNQNMFPRSDHSVFAGSEVSGMGAYPRSESCDRNSYPTTEFANRELFSRPEVNGNEMFSRPEFNGNKMLSRPEFNGNERFSGPEFKGNEMFSRPQLNRSGDMFPGAQLRSADTFSRSPLGGSNMHPSSQFSNGGVIPGLQTHNRNDVFPRPGFSGAPVSGVPRTPPTVPYPYNGRPHQGPSPSRQWNVSPDSFTRQTRPQNFGTSPQEKPHVPSQQNRPKFKPAKNQLKKKQFPKLQNDGMTQKPWMTGDLYAAVKKKNEMYVKAKASGSAEVWQEFRLQRSNVRSLIKEAKMKSGFIHHKKKEDENGGKQKPFSCDTCDRAYAEESKLEEHLRGHKKCEIDGCQFEAHPKVVALHKTMQHDTGYANIISRLDDDAEVKKWRNERKSHFPTMENIKKRQAEQEEKVARGETLETKDFGKFKKRGSEGQHDQSSRGWNSARGRRGRHRGRGRVRRSGNRLLDGKLRSAELDEDSISDDDSHIKLHKFLGIAVFPSISTVDVQDSTSVQNAQTCQETDLKCVDSDMSELAGVNSQHRSRSPDTSAMPNPKKTGDLQNLPLSSKEGSKALSCEDVPAIIEELMQLDGQAHHKMNGCLLESDPVSCVSNDQKMIDLESEDDGPTLQPIVKETETMCHVANTTQDSADADLESEDEGPTVQPIVKEIETTCHVTNTTQDSALAVTTGRDQESHRGPKNTPKPRVEKTASNCNPERYRKLNGESAGAKAKQSNLLEKLLANDIRHERNVIQQFIRYANNNNFFGVAGYRTSKS